MERSLDCIYIGSYRAKEYVLSAERTARRSARAKRQRTRIIFRNCVSSIAVLMAVMTVMILLNGFASQASDKRNVVEYKYYTSVVIPAGHSFSDVAAEYYDSEHYDSVDDFKSEIASINHIAVVSNDSEPVVHSGDNLIIPYYSAEYR